mgnify:CR=1 FL=1
MDTIQLIAELEKTASELEAQAEAVKTASVNSDSSSSNFSSFIDAMASELGLKE